MKALVQVRVLGVRLAMQRRVGNAEDRLVLLTNGEPILFSEPVRLRPASI